MAANKYSVFIYWNKTDEAFIAGLPELKGCIAHGNNQDDALREVNTVAAEWLAMARENGWMIPALKGRLLFA